MPRVSRHALALVLMLALMATAWIGLASGGISPTGQLNGVSVSPGENTAQVNWTVQDVPAKVVVEYGTDNRYGVWSAVTTALDARSGHTTLTGLEPNTNYVFHILAVSQVSRLDATGAFSTYGAGAVPQAAVAPLTPTAVSTSLFTANTSAPSLQPMNLTIDGGPIFPRMVWRQCPGQYPDSVAAGINVFLGTACSSPAAGLSALGALGGKGFAAVDVTSHGLSGPGLIGYHLPDEGDESVGSAAGQPTIHDPGKVTFLTLTDHFAPYMAPPHAGRGIYPGWFSRADVIGFDTYPIEGRCRFDLIPTVYGLQRTMVQMAAGKPTFQWIEVGPMEKCFKIDPTVASVQAETWLAIAGGARGIGYFPDYFAGPIRGAITAINHDIVSLAPALLDEAGTGIVGPGSTIRVGVRRHNGAVYVIAVNSSTKPTTGRILVPGLGDRTLTVFGENRTVPSSLSQLVDNFDGLGVHIYIAPPAGF